LQGQIDSQVAALVLPQNSFVTGMGTLTIAATINSGVLDPGDTFGGGEIDFPGALEETAFGLIHIDLFGTSEANTFDQITVHGFTTLDGALDVDLDGYTPGINDTFKILDLPGGYTGTFSTVITPVFQIGGSYYTLEPRYDAYDVTLVVVSASSSVPTVSSVSPSS